MEERIVDLIDYGLLGMTLISSLTCLARADFNFVFSLVTYYLWTNLKSSHENREDLGKKIIYFNLGLMILDLVCIISLSNVWGGDTDPDSSLHGFVLFASWINFLVRIIVTSGIVYTFRETFKFLEPSENRF